VLQVNRPEDVIRPGEKIASHELVSAAIARLFDDLTINTQAARESENPEAIHDMRVASRRLRSAVSVFAPLFARRRRRRTARKLRALTCALGGTREWDVIHQMLCVLRDASTTEGCRAALEHVLERVEKDRQLARSTMRAEIERMDLSRLRKSMSRLLAGSGTEMTREDLASLAWEAISPKLDAALGSLDLLRARERPDELHRARVATKKLRYALELLEPAFRGRPAPLLSQAKALQEILGQHHDAVVLENVLAATQAQLRENTRETLAKGLNDPLGRVRLDRLAHYEEFRDLTTDWSLDSFAAEVKAGLGFPTSEVSRH
jgi:CHAD domain-containing protein